jgi:diketogulonate reductase-like aldo/keto reductase
MSNTIALNDGTSMPKYGCGIFRRNSVAETQSIVEAALRAGIRHFELCELFGNAQIILDQIYSNQIRREDIYITYRIWPKGRQANDLINSLRESLDFAGLDNVDLLVIHTTLDTDTFVEQYKALEQTIELGLTRSLGVCNAVYNQVVELLKNCQVPPAVFEIEVSPFRLYHDTIELCIDNSIVILAIESQNKGLRIDDDRLVRVAESLRMNPSDVLTRWCLAKGYGVLYSPNSDFTILQEVQFGDDGEWVMMPKDVMELLQTFDGDLRTTWVPVKEEDSQ